MPSWRRTPRLDEAVVVAGLEALEEGRARLAVIGVDHVEDVHRRRLDLVVAERLAPGAVGEQDAAIRRHALDEFARAVDDVAQLGFAASQFLGALAYGGLEVGVEAVHLRFGELALADVQIGAEHARHLTGGVAQRHLARQQRQGAAVGRGLRLFDVQGRPAGCDDRQVVSAIAIGDVRPGHREVVLADDARRLGEPGVAGELGVAAQIAKVAVLPEHAHRNGVENGAEHIDCDARRASSVLDRGDVLVDHAGHRHRALGVAPHDAAAIDHPLPFAGAGAHPMLRLVARRPALEVRLETLHHGRQVVGAGGLEELEIWRTVSGS
ncbi:MAG: hypothetical protein U0P30_12450 [Vicinamibacterales bacterium]